VAHVFISYSEKHRELTERVTALLAAQSLVGPDGTAEPITVWRDKSLRSGDVFHREITQEIDKAGAVVVIWSEGAVASDWVYAEVQRGAARRKLVPLRDPTLARDRIPLPFTVFHIDEATNDAAMIASVKKSGLAARRAKMSADFRATRRLVDRAHVRQHENHRRVRRSDDDGRTAARRYCRRRGPHRAMETVGDRTKWG